MNALSLSAEHWAELQGSCIDPSLIDGRGYLTVGVERRQELVDHGLPRWAVRSDDAFPGLFIPLHRVSGEFIGFQFKPAQPQPRPGTDKTVKYISPKGLSNRLDVHPLRAAQVRDTMAPLWITEGVKKADALTSRGLACVALTGVWNWRNQEGTLGDWEDIPLRGRTVVVCFDADAPANPQVRNAMIRLVGWLRSKQAEAYYLAVPDKVGQTAVKGVDDYFAAGGTLEGLQQAVSQRAPEAPSARDAAFSDAFLTDTVCEESLQDSFLYARGLGWMRYDGARWCETGEPVLVEEIRRWAMGHWNGVLEEYKRDQSREVRARMDGWRQVLSSGRLKALASLARGPLHVEASGFDSHPDLLNCPNGVVDLTTGELLDPDPSYLMTKVTGAPYLPGADSEDFRKALCALPDDVQSWYQTRIGQAFTGYIPSDDRMLVQQGSGENGKSTLAVPITRAAGGYHVLVSDRVILGNADQHPTEMMDLRGARVALMEETPEARQLNVQQLKKVVGTPQITARHIRQDSVTFDASHALFVNTNYAPAVVEANHATWRRMSLVRFPYTFRSDPQEVTGPMDRLGDPGLRERCMTQSGPAAAALAWAVQGAVRWYAADKQFPPLPERIVTDTLAWRRDGDLIMTFLEDHLETGDGYVARSADLFQAFGAVLQAGGQKPWSQKTFNARFGGHDQVVARRVEYTRHRTMGSVWCGVRIIPREEVMPGVTGPNPFATISE